MFSIRSMVDKKSWTDIILVIYRRFYQSFSNIINSVLFILVLPIHVLIIIPVLKLLKIKFVNLPYHAIGHLGIDPDAFIKEGILGDRPLFKAIWLIDKRKTKKNISNPTMLYYWKEYIYIVSSSLLINFLYPLLNFKKINFDVSKYSSITQKSAYAPIVFKKWGNRNPLLRLTDKDIDYGMSKLNDYGITKDSWFVTIHCRESGYDKIQNPNKRWDEEKQHQNADITNYFNGFEEIVKRGGWCIRVGDSSMKPLPKLDNVIDYANSEIKSDRMDVFLLASSKFHIGHSGVFSIASSFGVPYAMVNQPLLGAVTLWGDVAIPKLFCDNKTNELIPFGEILSSDIGNYDYKYQFDKIGISLVENSDDEIFDVILEMFMRSENKMIYTDKDDELQNSFKTMLSPDHHGYYGNARIGKNFLIKYKHLIK